MTRDCGRSAILEEIMTHPELKSHYLQEAQYMTGRVKILKEKNLETHGNLTTDLETGEQLDRRNY